MKRTPLGPMQPLDMTIPDPALIVLIGAAGSGKSTWASTWPSTQVLELDQLRAMVSDDFPVKLSVLRNLARSGLVSS
ncbi:hypothetical protein ADK70_31530 [Streptomyces rimosus subsp. pseudoverticillatus]|uniref:AAA family ATPase n=1 Tax=Streptomyces rimosus TaxID=1927 RepID=UPI0006B29443|nr:hypothetical protein ADK70_31530 [Streptomyces rimosus subsp. pseudoverticillatus]